MSEGVTLSVCMIVRDESPVLARCLDGVRVFADEIIIVDTGSVDDTKQIARRYTDRVYDFPWIDDFSAARNVSYSYASKDYVMWLDADDVVSPADAEELKALKKTLPRETDVVYLLYGGETDQKNIMNNMVLFRDRWMRRSLNPRWQGRLHEFIPCPPEAVRYFADRIRILHCKVRVNDPDRNMRIHRLCMAEQKEPPVRDLSFLCNEYFGQERYSDAVSLFNELTARDPFPRHEVCFALLAYIQSMKALKKTDELIGRLLSLRENGIENEMLLCELGAACLARNQLEEAEHWLLETLRTPVDYRDMMIHFEAYREFIPCQKLSKLYMLLGKEELAYQFFTRAEKIYPENRSIRVNRLYFASRHAPA
ncbi:MAG: glycosyltransferase family 2 protein [Clostridia bacterium]|nr:glycosyltransferase family 2 protein [Clostridia bacterium]